MYSIGNLILNGTLVIATLWIVNRYLRTFYNRKKIILQLVLGLCLQFFKCKCR